MFCWKQGGIKSIFLAASLEARHQRRSEEEARRQRELETARQLVDEQSQRAEEQSRAASRLRWLAAGLALVLLLAVALGWLANNQRVTAEANFVEVFVGIESPDEEVLERNRKYQNIRHPLIESLNTININGLSV